MYSDWAKKSKADKQLVYRALLSLYKIGQSLKGKDFDAVLELLQQHPDAENKIGVGGSKPKPAEFPYVNINR